MADQAMTLRQPTEADLSRTVAELEQRLQASLAERDELLEQRSASAEILKVINASPGDLTPVFDIILEKAHSLCDVPCGSLQFYDGDHLRSVAVRGMTESFEKFLRQGYRIPDRIRQNIDSRHPVQVADLAEVLAQRSDDSIQRAAVELGGIRTMLSVPLVRDGIAFGRIVAARREVRPFTDKQIALLQGFADQAVIAIQNARLFNETREALERQTSTADILKVIASSPSDVQPVFKAIAECSHQLLGAHSTAVWRFIDDAAHLVAFTSTDPAGDSVLQGLSPLRRDRFPGLQLMELGESLQFEDTEAVESYLSQDAAMRVRDVARARGYRSQLLTPLISGREPIGFISVARKEPGTFAAPHVQLLRTFADQAVIAIQNTRLFNETREALERQTATADILEVIAGSPSDVQPIFDAIVKSAAKLFGPCGATITTLKDGQLHFNATGATLPGFEIERARAVYPIPFDPDRSPSARAMLERRIIEIPDVSAPDTPEFTRKAAAAGGFQSITFVPLVHQDYGIGTIILSHPQAGFKLSDKQLALLKTFADQAVIAIQNARLFNETREALEQQTATSEVLKVISASPGELEPVFQAMLTNAVHLCEANFGMLFLYEQNEFRAVGMWNLPPAYRDFLGKAPIRADPKIPMGRVLMTKQPVQVADVFTDPSYVEGYPGMIGVGQLGGARTLLQVPLLKDDQLVGTIAIYRQEVRPFNDKQVALVQNFAAQAVIAIENGRLLSELRQRTDDLTQSLDDLRAAQDRLVQTEKLASLGQLTAGIAHEIKNPLNFVNNFSALSTELIDELEEALAPAALDQKLRGEVGELTGMLKSNLEKVVQHGKRADSIVKNMLLHSREGGGEHRTADINALVEESLNLAYHGARAEKSGFNVTLRRELDPDAGMVELYPQEITRVLLNLVSNGFYAVTKRKEAADGTFEPILSAATKSLGDRVEIRIRDNGTGIPLEVKEKMFNPFFTTKPAGEGTGLGLSMSHDIVVKQHGGKIDVDTEPGVFTEFIITLPRNAAAQLHSGGTN
jgi:two-component system NtrC family sensor kinase